MNSFVAVNNKQLGEALQNKKQTVLNVLMIHTVYSKELCYAVFQWISSWGACFKVPSLLRF